MKKYYFFLLLFCILQINLVTTKAQLYWSESFSEYGVGQSIAGSAVNGPGLSGTWSFQGSTGAIIKNTATLTSSGLWSDPNYISNGSLGYSSLGVGFQPMTTSSFYNDYKSDATAGMVGYKATSTKNNEFWYSLLVRADLSTGYQLIGFTQITNGFNPAYNLGNFFIKCSAGTWTLNECNGASTILSSATYPGFTSAVGATTLVVIKVNYASTGTTYTLYLNPTPGTTPSGGTALTTTTAQKFTGLTFYGGNAASLSFDEMRIGATYADVTPADVPDTTPPTAPTGLTASNIGMTSVTLSWTASTDNIGVTGYKVYRGTTYVGFTTSTSMQVTGLTSNTAYSFTVVAQDAKLNTATSAALPVTTLIGPIFVYTEGNGTLPTVSNTDLLQTSASITAQSGTATGTYLTDGSATTGTGVTGLPQVAAGTSITYTFNTTTNTSGYNITGIDIYTAWQDNGRVNPNVTVSYSLIGSPTTYTIIGTATYSKVLAAVAGSAAWTKTSITFPVGFNPPTAVKNLKFDFGTQQNNAVGYAEIDVFGAPTVDNQAPSVPTGLSSTAVIQSGFTLNWTASTDNFGVASYEVFKDGVSVGTTTTTNMNITGLAPTTTYVMTVTAKDAAGNTSAASSPLSVTTVSVDNQAPTVPTALVSSAITSTGFTLSWTASTDNVGVALYSIYKDGTPLITTNLTTVNITGLASATTYSITVKAADAAGNISPASDALSVTTAVYVPTSTGTIENFNDNVLTNWYSGPYVLSETNQELKIVPAKAGVWDGFGFRFPRISLKNNPRVSLRIKSNFAFNIAMAVGRSDGKIDNYPTHPNVINVVGAQPIEASSEYQEYSFDYTGLSTAVLDTISNLHFVLNPYTTTFGDTSNKVIYFDDIKIGDVAAHSPAIMNIKDQAFTVKASGTSSRMVKFAYVNDGSLGQNPITITAVSSNPAVIPNPQVTYSSPATTGSILLTPNVTALGESVISVIVSSPNATDKVMTFKVKVIPNVAPSMQQPANMIVKKGDKVTVALNNIYTGNPESFQKITITAKSSNVSVIPDVTIKRDSTDYVGSLSFTPSVNTTTGTVATISVRLKDDGGIVSNGVDSAFYSFNVTVYDQVNHQPTLDSIPPKSVQAIAGTYNMPLTGLSDGDNNTQHLSFVVTASTDSVLTNLSVGTVVNGTAPLNYTLTGKTGKTTLSITVTDDGGNAGNNGNLSITRSFVVTSVIAPVTGLVLDYTPYIGKVAPGINSAQTNSLVEVLPDGSVHIRGTKSLQTFPANNFSLTALTGGKALDMSANKYVSFKIKCASTNKIELPSPSALAATQIFFRLLDNIPAGQPGSGYQISMFNLSIPDDDAWHDFYLDFNGKFYKDASGHQTDSTRITTLMLDINCSWFQQITGDYYFKDLKVGDKADRPATPIRPTVDNIPNQVIYKGQAPKPVTLTGITDGAGNKAATLTAFSDKPSLISGISFGPVVNGTALLNYSLNTGVADSAKVTVVAKNTTVLNTLPDTLSFKVYVTDTVAIANNIINIDFSKTHQTMAGLGTFLNTGNDAAEIQRIKDQNITVMRFTENGEFEPVNDNSDPNVMDFSNFNRKAIPTDLIRKINEQTNCHKFFYTPWTPPSWMKQNKAGFPDPSTLYATNNILSPDMYEEFAEYLAAICKTVKEESGVELYAMSLQNEPSFNEPYVSCQYTGAQFRDLMKVVGPRFKAENLNTRIMLSEDVGQNNWVQNNVGPTNADPVARQYLGIVACHNYDPDGIKAGGQGTSGWASLLAFKNTTLAEGLWMTETSGFSNIWEGVMGTNYLNGQPQFFPGPLDYAGCIYTALKAGNISAWTDLDGTAYKVTNNLEGSAFKNFSSYVNPGSVMVDAISGNSQILSLAFKNADNSVTAILLNTSGKPVKVTLQGQNVPQVYRSFITQNYSNISEGATVTNGSIVLPPRSIATLYHTDGNLAPTVDPISNVSMVLAKGDSTITLTGISYGKDLVSQNVTGVTATSNNSAIATASVTYTANSSTAKLIISPKGYGTAQITVKVKDDGGTANGGIDSTLVKFYVNVTSALNHTPTINTVNPISILEDADSVRVQLTGITDGDNGTQKLQFVVTSSNTALVSTPVVAYTGGNTAQLVFKPTAKTFGTTNLSIVLTDNGGDAYNNGNLFVKIDIPVTVVFVNHAPIITTSTTTATIDVGVIKRFLITLDNGDPGVVQTLTSSVTVDNPSIATATFTGSANPYTLNVRGVSNGTVNVKLLIRDNGGIANGGVDSTSVVFNVTVGATGIEETSNGSISLYPNPTDDYMFVTLDNENPESVTITDVFGRIMVQKPVSGVNNKFKLSVSDLPKGLYFITVKSNVQSHTLKFVRR